MTPYTPTVFSKIALSLALVIASMASANSWASAVEGKPNASCPQFAPGGFPFPENTQVAKRAWHICHQAYSSYVDPVTKGPLWSAEMLLGEGLDGEETRTNDFRPDPEIPRSIQAKSQAADFAHSGLDQGHLAPAGDFRTLAPEIMSESFYYSNIVPQDAKNNRNVWQKLEIFTRQWAMARGKVYVVTGPMFDQGKTLGPPLGSTGLAVPTHMFKVVIDYSRMEAIAFVIPNKPIFPDGVNESSRGTGSLRQWEQEISKYSVSIRDIENWSGLRFNAALSAADREKLNTQKSAMWPTKANRSKKSGKKKNLTP